MKPQLMPSTIMAAVARDVGDLSYWEPVAEGEESQAFAIRFGGGEYILRVNRSADGFRKDEYCYRHFASADLPIPEIVSIGSIDNENAYCISERSPGLTLQDMNRSDVSSVAVPVMKVLETMASEDVAGIEGFGPFNECGIGRFGEWRDFLMSITDTRCYDWEALQSMLGERQIDAYIQVLSALAAQCPEMRRLVHGDFGSNNVLSHGGQITGVIDWSEAMIGDPLYDIANIFFWRTWLECMEVQAQYIENNHRDIMRQSEILRCYQLRIGLDVIYSSAMDRDEVVFEWAMERCDEIVRLS
ncbi:aminoglycoside phosphotransferase family protein [Paenibacillus lignilyticus]|uniref:Aminoglycoside phosphotransferase family protein n=1 Tax=Paenibacillus lignilyticus TaxID=1172615 RepID=A0ABS5CAX6_9BACL|nr:aminoglycoside phosphotransferase family protein [Paenibacillus lignilyticus]MBP3963126.1 aminoglycoside phosphotransferase family protein [Paenibacillus lignilyticus]